MKKTALSIVPAVEQSPEDKFAKWILDMPRTGYDTDDSIRISVPVSMSLGFWTATVEAASLKGMTVEEFISWFLTEEVCDFTIRECKTTKETAVMEFNAARAGGAK